MGWLPEEASQMCKAWFYSSTSSQTWFLLSPPSLIFFFCIVSSVCKFKASLDAFSYDSVACFTSIQPPVFIVHVLKERQRKIYQEMLLLRHMRRRNFLLLHVSRERHFSERAEVERVGSTPAVRWNTSFAMFNKVINWQVKTIKPLN